jgi:hypothetical protein
VRPAILALTAIVTLLGNPTMTSTHRILGTALLFLGTLCPFAGAEQPPAKHHTWIFAGQSNMNPTGQFAAFKKVVEKEVPGLFGDNYPSPSATIRNPDPFTPRPRAACRPGDRSSPRRRGLAERSEPERSDGSRSGARPRRPLLLGPAATQADFSLAFCACSSR